MEATKAGKSRKIVIAVGLIAALVLAACFFVYKSMRILDSAPLDSLVRKDLPVLDLDLQFINMKGEKIERTRLGGSPGKSEEPAPETPPESCAELVGGDASHKTKVSPTEKIQAECPKKARWVVKSLPIALSLTIQDARSVLSLFGEKGRVQELFKTRFFQGIFYDPLHTASVRAEDLHLEGLNGALLGTLIREGIAAHGTLHYDVAHGKRGFVFSFVRNECPYAAKALPVIMRSVVRSGYRIAGLKTPILEMRIGLQRLFLAEYEKRIYLANGLEALINVLENLPVPGSDLPKTPVVLTLRPEAFMEKIVPVMTGGDRFEANIGFALSENNPGVLQFNAGKLTKRLCPKLFKGVLAGIPHDVFAAVATSFHLPPSMTTQEWRELATRGPAEGSVKGPDEGGFAILWDVSSDKSQLTSMGVVIANQGSPDEAAKFKQYFAKPELTAECGGGTVFLAATSSGLLARMRESCAGQSFSVLDWEKGKKAKEYAGSQLLLFMNPGTAMREILIAGGAANDEESDAEASKPKWKEEYEKAKEAMRKDGEKVFSALPIFAYSGNVAPNAETAQLNGFTVKQGGAR